MSKQTSVPIITCDKIMNEGFDNFGYTFDIECMSADGMQLGLNVSWTYKDNNEYIPFKVRYRAKLSKTPIKITKKLSKVFKTEYKYCQTIKLNIKSYDVMKTFDKGYKFVLYELNPESLIIDVIIETFKLDSANYRIIFPLNQTNLNRVIIGSTLKEYLYVPSNSITDNIIEYAGSYLYNAKYNDYYYYGDSLFAYNYIAILSDTSTTHIFKGKSKCNALIYFEDVDKVQKCSVYLSAFGSCHNNELWTFIPGNIALKGIHQYKRFRIFVEDDINCSGYDFVWKMSNYSSKFFGLTFKEFEEQILQLCQNNQKHCKDCYTYFQQKHLPRM